MDAEVLVEEQPAKCEAFILVDHFLFLLLLPVAFGSIFCHTVFRRPSRVRHHLCIFIIGPLWPKSILGSKSQKTQSHYWRVVPLPGPWPCYGVLCGLPVLVFKCHPCTKTPLPLARTNSNTIVSHEIFIYDPNGIESFRHLGLLV